MRKKALNKFLLIAALSFYIYSSFVFISSTNSYAAFPIAKEAVESSNTTVTYSNAKSVDVANTNNSINNVVSQKQASKIQKFVEKIERNVGDKSQIAAALICFFVGVLGVHRFYLGYTTEGIIQLLTGGVCGIWTLIDLIRIIIGDLQPKNGKYYDEF